MAAADSEKEATEIITQIADQLNSCKTSPNKDTLIKFLKASDFSLIYYFIPNGNICESQIL